VDVGDFSTNAAGGMMATVSTANAQELDTLCINTIRTLSMDAVQQANSGHPGTPMGMAPVAYELWQEFLAYDPQDAAWPNRDRFVLSIGHASMLLYSMLHLTGVKQLDSSNRPTDKLAVPLEDIKRFRQLESRCPGHPEYRWTSGVETTTGPLGQGVANSVGMAIAERWLAKYFNRPGFEVFKYNVYAMCGDGDMMEGISSEAGSLAGHLKLGNLCWIYDSNRITIEGSTDLAFNDDVAGRFASYGWNVAHVTDANDTEALGKAIRSFQSINDRPTMIIVNSHIGYGAPTKHDTKEAHGEPLGEEEIKGAKKFYGWPEDAKFLVPDGVREHFQEKLGKRGGDLRAKWNTLRDAYAKQFPDLAKQLDLMLKRELPDGWDKNLPVFPADAKGMAGRDASGKALNVLAQNVPWIMGGAADLAPSTKTRLTAADAGDFQADNYGGRNMHFGIREHVMAAILNGMSLSHVRPYGSGFLIFSDYARASIRLSAIMEIPTIHVFTHDSIGVGEDGPTHQPIEQLASLRAIPGMHTFRPGDANEMVEAWKVIMKFRHEPALLLASRQPIPVLDRTKYAAAAGVAKGGYILADAEGGKPDVILIGSGTEVPLCVEAYEKLKAEGVKARVVSLPCWELFAAQEQSYRDTVLPPAIKARVAVEMASTFGWERYVGTEGKVVGMRSFGASAPLKDLLKHFGFTVEAVMAAAKDVLKAR
jgi:transketolase